MLEYFIKLYILLYTPAIYTCFLYLLYMLVVYTRCIHPLHIPAFYLRHIYSLDSYIQWFAYAIKVSLRQSVTR